MSNLLKDASILLTPTAYDNGSMLAIKPENGDGDFAFSRNSAATRVNAQGLVENVQILSSNLVSNGNFSQEGVQEVSNGSFSQEGSEQVTNGDFATDSDWTKGTGWSIGDGSASCDGESGNLIQSITGSTPNKTFLITFTLSNYITGSVTPSFVGAYDSSLIYNANGTYSAYINSVADNRLVFYSQAFIGSIDNVSVKEVGQDWTLGTGWSIGDDKAVATNSLDGERLRQNNVFTAGKTYKVTYEITEITQGSFRGYVGGTNLTTRSAVGVYTEIILAPLNDVFYIRTIQTTSGSISNISVKEVGQDWTLGGTATIGDNLVNINSPSGENAEVYQSSVLVIGRKYKLDCKLNKTSGDTQFVNGGTFILNNGSNVIQFTATDTRVYFKRGAGSVISSITNISVIEITDDTNLPRINYEGFSYQDSLGSEEIVNGDFSNGLSNWVNFNVSLVDGGANLNNIGLSGQNTYVKQAGYISGNSYKLELDVISTNGADLVLENASGASIGTQTIGHKTVYFTQGVSSEITIKRLSGDTNVVIDNVSVKEYLGQEVVPDSGCGSWLMEGQSTNLIPYSEDFSQWTDSGVLTKTGNYAVSPSGAINATRLQWGSGTNYTYQNTSHIGSDFTQSIYLKSNTGINQFVKLFMDNAAQTKEVEVTTQWQRFEFKNYIATTQSNRNVGLISSNSQVGDLDILVYGAQLEQQSKATSYIPTSGAIKTRLRDIPNNGGNASLINSEEGVLYFEGKTLVNGVYNSFISLSDGTNDNLIMIRFGVTANRISIFARGSGGSYSVLTINGVTQTDNNKIALVWDSVNFRIWVNGVEVATMAINSSPVGMSKLSFSSPTGGDLFFGENDVLALLPILTNEQLNELTTQ